MLSRFPESINFADVLTRRRESYHEIPKHSHHGEGKGAGTQSIHDIERESRLTSLPPIDAEPRAILVDRLLGDDVTHAQYTSGAYKPVRSWAAVPMTATVNVSTNAAVITLRANDLEKRLTFDAVGCLAVAYSWNTDDTSRTSWFAPELSLAQDLALDAPAAAETWRHQITTVARSERGFEETIQGVSLTPRWPARLGACALELGGGPSP